MSNSNHDDKVRDRAYHIWESEGRPHGRHEQHWQDALRDIAAGASDAVAAVKKTVRKAVGKVTAAVVEPKPAPPVSARTSPKATSPASSMRKPKALSDVKESKVSSPASPKIVAPKKTRRVSAAGSAPKRKAP
jgi:hypothetical protein